MEFDSLRNKLVLNIYEAFKGCFVKNEHGYDLIDPYEKRVIGFHYGETHTAVALVLYGYVNKNDEMRNIGTGLLQSFLENISTYQAYKEYHWDFNNIALCVLVEFLEKSGINDFPITVEQLKKFIIAQKDSVHGTINWMPMRAYTNWCKYCWTNEEKYMTRANEYIRNVEQAKYEDGFYEDFLPKGKSFNFQYHIYTTAMMDFLSRRMPGIIDQKKAIENCVNIIDVEGDVNYLGRGCNQIFAWGPAIYVMHMNEKYSALYKMTGYLEQKLQDALKNYNLILNDTDGKDRIWWWDYHYSSVYYGHLMFWLMLTCLDNPRLGNGLQTEVLQNVCGDSGVSIIHFQNAFVCTFGGRKHYLAEKGPMVANVGFEEIGTIFKGPLGPFGGQFGNKYAELTATVENYLGPISKTQILGCVVVKNMFPKELITQVEDSMIVINYKFGKKVKNIYFSIPLFCRREEVVIRVLADGAEEILTYVGDYNGPYGKTQRLQTRKLECSDIRITFSRPGGKA